jgi:outer membrane lipoprotein SlyB
MKLSLLVGAAVGYVLGARAGRARYETIARMARAVAGSPQVQSGAQIAQHEATDLSVRLRHAIGRLLTHDAPPSRR